LQNNLALKIKQQKKKKTKSILEIFKIYEKFLSVSMTNVLFLSVPSFPVIICFPLCEVVSPKPHLEAQLPLYKNLLSQLGGWQNPARIE